MHTRFPCSCLPSYTIVVWFIEDIHKQVVCRQLVSDQVCDQLCPPLSPPCMQPNKNSETAGLLATSSRAVSQPCWQTLICLRETCNTGFGRSASGRSAIRVIQVMASVRNCRYKPEGRGRGIETHLTCLHLAALSGLLSGGCQSTQRSHCE